MGKHKKQHNSSNLAIVTDVTARPPKPRRKKIIILSSLLILLLIAASVGYAWKANTKKAPDVALASGQAINSQVEISLSKDEVKALADSKVNPSKNLDKAYAKALALTAQDDNKAALVEYEKIMKLDSVPYYIIADYGYTLIRNGETRKGIQTLQQAIDTLKKDASIKAEVKKTEAQKLQDKITAFKLEANL